MKRIKFISMAVIVIFIVSFIACMKTAGPETDVVIRILARRIAYHGIKSRPHVFTALGIVARNSCQTLTDEAQPADVAFQIILKTISTKTSDPLLAQDIQDVVKLLGIQFDSSFNLLGISPEALNLISMFVCSFAAGAELSTIN
ncbi:hypothetical protein ES703_11323 [subsurface metagenome]